MGQREERAERAIEAFRAKVRAWSGLEVIPRLDEALTHPSSVNEEGGCDNQRLEFLGDAILGMLVSELLAAQFPEANEGVLTRLRSQLVSADALAEFAAREELGSALRLGKGARAAGEGERTNVLCDALEAVVASVYFAGGLQPARQLVQVIVGERLQRASATPERDPKSELQELVQAEGAPTPRYVLVSREGPVHRATFLVEVWVGEEKLGEGSGPSKKAAERNAASAALQARSSLE